MLLRRSLNFYSCTIFGLDDLKGINRVLLYKELSLTSKCHVSVEAMRSPGSIPTGGNILSLDVFHVVKHLLPILALLPILSICEKSK